MYKVGVFPGKFFPPHRGHLNSIINAATQCEKLYVVVSNNPKAIERACKESKIRLMDLKLRTRWMSVELQSFDHIKVIMFDEDGIPEYPAGWELWSEKLLEVVPEKFDVIFGGETKYAEQYNIKFPDVKYELFDYGREKYPISATMIRSNPLKYWDYILGVAREHFAKRVLITGTESCGKTTITRYLGKIYCTSWAEDEGRYYSDRYLGGNEEVFTVRDFEGIAHKQYLADEKALKACNRVVFFDTDAIVTQYYLGQYLNNAYSDYIERFVDRNKYDVVLMFTPDVKWVDDGQRFLSGDELRWKLHDKLKNMYIDRGFGEKIIEIKGNYNQRLNQAISIIDNLLK